MERRRIFHSLSGVFLRTRASYTQYLYPTLSRVYGFAGVLSLAVLIVEFGFYNPDAILPHRREVVSGLIYLLLGYEFVSLIFSSGGQSSQVYLRTRSIQLIAVVLVSLLLVFRAAIFRWLDEVGIAPASGNPGEVSDRALLFFLGTGQVILLVASLVHLLRRTQLIQVRGLNPSLIFVGSFAVVILAGFLLLLLPRMQRESVAIWDVLFTVVSAVCVTGLSTVNIASAFSTGGLVLIMLLIQVGGLGLMTLTSFFAFFLTGRASVGTRVLLRDLLSDEGLGRVKSVIRNIAFLTFTVELVGAVVLYWTMPAHLYASPAERVFAAAFHAISAFCNAGFALHPDSLAGLDGSVFGRLYVGAHICLIVIGGLGFPVVMQILEKLRRLRGRRAPRFSVTTRLVLIVNGLLLVGGTLLYLLLEGGATLSGMSYGDRIWNSLFYAVTMRTAGFNTLPVAEMGMAMTFLSFLFMWIGASPLSTGGGIKTTTAALSFLHIVSQITGKDRVELFKKTISPPSINRAFATIVLSWLVIFLGVFFLLITETAGFVDVAFEAVSAFATVGLSRGITGDLSVPGKLILCALMLCGRVGVVTALLAFTPKAKYVAYRYPGEYVVVG